MAKGLRSKIKKVFRSQKRQVVANAPWQLEAERKRQEALRAIIEAPKPEPPPTTATDHTDRPTKMDADTVITDDLPEVTAQNSAKILKKLKARRAAKGKGGETSVPKKKKAKPLAGANQFHKKKNKKKKKR